MIIEYIIGPPQSPPRAVAAAAVMCVNTANIFKDDDAARNLDHINKDGRTEEEVCTDEVSLLIQEQNVLCPNKKKSRLLLMMMLFWPVVSQKPPQTLRDSFSSPTLFDLIRASFFHDSFA